MSARPRRLFLPALAIAALALAACGGDDGGGGDDGALRVVVSTTILEDWVENVGGEHVTVQSLVPPNADVHTFVLTPADVRAAGEADVIFLVGQGLEAPFIDEIRQNAGGRLVEVAEGLPLQPFADAFADEDEDEEEEHDDDEYDHGELDPHIWMDIELAAMAVERIRDELGAIDPENADAYETNAAAYVDELRALDAEIAAMFEGLPEERRYLVTFHDAFGYFARAYGLTILGFVVENPDAEPSARELADLIEAVREAGVPYIFTEPQFNARVVDQVASEADVEVRTIPSGGLRDDYPTYIEFMRAIATGITE